MVINNFPGNVEVIERGFYRAVEAGGGNCTPHCRGISTVKMFFPTKMAAENDGL